MTTPSEIKKQIHFNIRRLRAADQEIANIAALRCRLWRDTLKEVQNFAEAKLAEEKAQAAAASGVSE